MKQFSTLFTILLTSAAIFILLSFGLPATASPAAASSTQITPTPASQSTLPQELVCDSKRSVQVSGTAVVNVVPDRALMQLGVQSNGATTRQVQDANSAATQAVIKSALAMGVESQDIATDWYVIEPIYDSYDSL